MKILRCTANLCVLRSDAFTLAALDAVHSLAMVHGVFLIVHICLLVGNGI